MRRVHVLVSGRVQGVFFRGATHAKMRSLGLSGWVQNLPDGRVESCGHFHGAPVGFACDFLAIAAAEVGAIAERRTDRMLDRNRSHGLPPFLAEDAGVNSGLMIAEVTAAALYAENKQRANPCSIDSTPTSANQEDHVSMAAHAARRLADMNANLAGILGIELLVASQGIGLRKLATSEALRGVIASLRAVVAPLGPDRYMAPDLAAAGELVRSGRLLAAARASKSALLPRPLAG